MALSKLSEYCKTCKFKETCSHKRMELVGYLKPLTESTENKIVQPMIVPHDYRNVKIAENTAVTIDIEELKEKLQREIYKGSLNCLYNA